MAAGGGGERAGGEGDQEDGRGALQLADTGEAARSTACRKSGSGTAPSKETRSLMTIFGTPITRWARASSGNSVASIAVERIRSDATDMCCARRTARGQYGQVGVEKTLISTSASSVASEDFVASLSAGSPLEATMIASIKLENSYPDGMPKKRMP